MTEAVELKTPRDVLVEKEEKSKQKPTLPVLRFDEILKLADWVLANPEKWPTVKTKLRNPRMTCRELAKKLGIGSNTVSRHLRALRQLRRT